MKVLCSTNVNIVKYFLQFLNLTKILTMILRQSSTIFFPLTHPFTGNLKKTYKYVCQTQVYIFFTRTFRQDGNSIRGERSGAGLTV